MSGLLWDRTLNIQQTSGHNTASTRCPVFGHCRYWISGFLWYRTPNIQQISGHTTASTRCQMFLTYKMKLSGDCSIRKQKWQTTRYRMWLPRGKHWGNGKGGSMAWWGAILCGKGTWRKKAKTAESKEKLILVTWLYWGQVSPPTQDINQLILLWPGKITPHSF